MTHPEAFQGTTTETLTPQDSKRILDRLTDRELLEGERRALIHHLIGETQQQHREAVELEIDHVANICRDRVIEQAHDDGSRSLYFATRNTTGEHPSLDDIYEMTLHADGTSTFQIDFMRSGDSGYRIEGDSEGNLSNFVLMQGYKKPIARDSDSEQRFFEDYMDRSLETARIMKTRNEKDPQAAANAHKQGKEMLAAYLEAHGVLVEQ